MNTLRKRLAAVRKRLGLKPYVPAPMSPAEQDSYDFCQAFLASQKRTQKQDVEEVRAEFRRLRKRYPLAWTKLLTATEKRRQAIAKGEISKKDQALILAAYNHQCQYCGRRATTLDHVTPIIRGGPHILANVVAACRSCNSRKHAGKPLKPVQPLLLL